MDFNRDGVERMLTNTDYAPNDADDVSQTMSMEIRLNSLPTTETTLSKSDI